MTRILILDDEEAAGNILAHLIRKFMPGDHALRIVHDPSAALDLLPAFQPDLVMLDIDRPGINGFDFLNRAGDWDFDVVFTTAYDQYAIKAIRFSALDYLLKPIDILDLQNALNRHVLRRQAGRDTRRALMHNLIANVSKAEQDDYKLAISTVEGVFFYQPSQIIRCEGESNYTRFYLQDQRPMMVSHTLKDYETILVDYGFIRIHKSHLVNMRFVTRVDRDGFLWLQNGDSVPVSRRRRDEVMQMLRK